MTTNGNQQPNPNRLTNDEWRDAISKCVIDMSQTLKHVMRGYACLESRYAGLCQEVAERNTLVEQMNSGFDQYTADQKAEHDEIVESCRQLRHGVEELMRQIKEDRDDDEPWRQSLKDDFEI